MLHLVVHRCKDILFSLPCRKLSDQFWLSGGCISLQWKVNLIPVHSSLLRPSVKQEKTCFSHFSCYKHYFLLKTNKKKISPFITSGFFTFL